MYWSNGEDNGSTDLENDEAQAPDVAAVFVAKNGQIRSKYSRATVTLWSNRGQTSSVSVHGKFK